MATAQTTAKRILQVLAWVGALILLMLVVALAYLWFAPLGLSARPAQAFIEDYDEAAARIQQITDAEGDAVNPVCHSRLLGHGKKTAQAIVFFHGLSNCPQQFAAIADSLYAQGYNVLLARLPRQGLADRLTDEPAGATAEEAVAAAEDAVDLAHGLGDEVIVVGMSGGGTLAAWLAQNRPDIHRVVMIAPLLGVQAFPADLTRQISTAVRLIPNWWGWFDPVLQDKAPGPQHGYPRFASRTIAEYLRVAAQVMAAAQTQPPAVKDIRIIGNLNDETVRPAMERTLAANWTAHDANVFVYEYPVANGLRHDLIDPAQPYQQADVVHPYVISVITAAEPTVP